MRLVATHIEADSCPFTYLRLQWIEVIENKGGDTGK